MSKEVSKPASTASSTIALTVAPESFSLVPHVSEDCSIQISNLSFVPVMFRLLTTSPGRYLVQSSRGVIQPCSSETVNISLHAAVTSNCHDDFKLEYCPVGPDDVIDPRMHNVVDLIKMNKNGNRKKIIRCRVVLQENSGAAAAAGNNSNASVLTSDSVASDLTFQQNSPAGKDESKGDDRRQFDSPNNRGSPNTGSADVVGKRALSHGNSGASKWFVVIPAIVVILGALFYGFA